MTLRLEVLCNRCGKPNGLYASGFVNGQVTIMQRDDLRAHLHDKSCNNRTENHHGNRVSYS